MRRAPLEAMVVVVPVRNEADLLERCLVALTSAVRTAEAAHLRCEVRIVLDACTDASEQIAARSGLPLLICDAARVGIARAVGIDDALRALDGVPADRVWIAGTDADSQVPTNWLAHQREVARVADVCLGTVRPDFDDLLPAQREQWLRTHPRGKPNGNVHGANLGVRARTYLDAGGFAPMGEHEDVDLVARCRRIGAVVVASDEAEVMTSGRVVGRTPGGYAGFLRRQASELVGDASGEST